MSDTFETIAAVLGLAGILSHGLNWNRGRRRLNVTVPRRHRFDDDSITFAIHNKGVRDETVTRVQLRDWRRCAAWSCSVLVERDRGAEIPITAGLFWNTWHGDEPGPFPWVTVETAAGHRCRKFVSRTILAGPTDAIVKNMRKRIRERDKDSPR